MIQCVQEHCFRYSSKQASTRSLRQRTDTREGEILPLDRARSLPTRISPRATHDASDFDVSRTVVQPTFRSVPWKTDRDTKHSKLRIVFVSESNVCRSVLAEAILSNLLNESGLDKFVECASRGTRDYNLGEGPDEAVLAAAENLSIFLPDAFKAQVFDYEKDIVLFDLVLVMDKYTAADVLREISVYDTVQKETQYSIKVRRLGEFHPQMKDSTEPDAQDIDDPLYGNFGGETARIAVEKTAGVIESACLGVLTYLQQIEEQSNEDMAAFRKAVMQDIENKECIQWLVPPMLQPRQPQ